MLELADEQLFVVEEVELIAVEEFLDDVDDYIDFAVSIELGYLVASADAPTVPLLEIGQPPRCIKVMNGHATLSGVDTRAQHLGAAEEYTDLTFVHAGNHRFALLLCLGFLNEKYLIFGNMVIFYQLTFDFTVRVPLVRLVYAQVGKDIMKSFSHWLENGMNIAQISYLLGHESIHTTMVYLDITTEQESKALETLEDENQKKLLKKWKNIDHASLEDFLGLC